MSGYESPPLEKFIKNSSSLLPLLISIVAVVGFTVATNVRSTANEAGLDRIEAQLVTRQEYENTLKSIDRRLGDMETFIRSGGVQQSNAKTSN